MRLPWRHGVASPDGKEFVIGDAKGRLQWLDLHTGKQKAEYITKLTKGEYRRRFADNRDENLDDPLAMWGIDYSPNGSWLASRNDAEINVFDSKAHEVGSLTINSRHGGWFAMSPDGNWVAAYGALSNGALSNPPAGILLWNVKTGQKIRLQSPSQTRLDFGFSSDGKQLYGIFAQNERFQFVTWRVEAPTAGIFGDRKEVSFQASEMMMGPSVPLAQAGQLIAMSTLAGVEIRQQDGTLLTKLKAFGPETQAMKFSLDGQFLSVRARYGPIELWDVKNGNLLASLQAGNASSGGNASSFSNGNRIFHDMAFSPDNTLFAYAHPNGNSQVVDLWSLEGQPRRLASFEQKETVNAITFSSDNKALICGDKTGVLQWIDVATLQIQDKTAAGEPILDITFAAQTLVVIQKSAITSYRVPANSRQPLHHGASPISISSSESGNPLIQSAISADGKLLATVRANQKIDVWHLTAGSLLQSFEGNQSAMFPSGSLDFSADGTQLTFVARQSDERRLGIITWRRVK